MRPWNEEGSAVKSFGEAVTNYKIPPDEQAILALQRVAGARVHEAANLIQLYKSFCYNGDKDSAAAAKRNMCKLAVQIERERGASATKKLSGSS